MKRLLTCLLVALVATACAQKDRPLKVGVLDTVRALESQPEVAGFRMEWAQEVGEIYLRLQKVKTPESYQDLSKNVMKRNEEWRKEVDQFLNKSVEVVRAQAVEVAKEKDLDIVVLDTSFMNSVQYYNGEDITLDVIVKMKNKS
ncbi:MAG: hypothetical protein AB7S38_04790 [Vulcanimicrobiota bacterium]